MVTLLVCVILALLFLPLDLSGRADPDLTCDDWEGDWSGTVGWSATLRFAGPLFKLTAAGEGLHGSAVQVWVLGIRLRSRSQKRTEAQASPAKPKRKRRAPDWELRRALLAEGWTFVTHLWRDLGWRLHGDLAYGLPDPALTGLCEAFLWSAGRPAALRLRPVFVQPCLTGWVKAHGRIYGIQIATAAWAACKDPVIRDRIKQRLRLRLWRTRTA